MVNFDPNFHEPVDMEASAWIGRHVTCDEMLPDLVFEVRAFDHTRRWFQLFGPIEWGTLNEGEPDLFWVGNTVNPVEDVEPAWLAD
jgi:hypothetical protein